MRNTVSELANQMAVLCLLYKTRDNKKLLALRVNAVFIAIFFVILRIWASSAGCYYQTQWPTLPYNNKCICLNCTRTLVVR